MTKIDPTSRLNVTQPTIRWVILRTRVHSIDILSKSHSAVSSVKKMKKHRYRNIHNVGLGRGQREKRRDGGKRKDAEMLNSTRASLRDTSIGWIQKTRRKLESAWEVQAAGIQSDEMRCDTIQPGAGFESAARRAPQPPTVHITKAPSARCTRTNGKNECSTEFFHFTLPPGPRIQTGIRANDPTPSDGNSETHPEFAKRDTALHTLRNEATPGGARRIPRTEGNSEVAAGADDMRAQAKGKEKEMEAQQKRGAAGRDGERRLTRKTARKIAKQTGKMMHR
ncbi:hypothetical protein K438DRAFT_1939774 [Mycena galopus ATCC 62051]|nr:hypothetical protein K438DRAFT_1939774 [Mycena galopus ATCC 62051]